MDNDFDIYGDLPSYDIKDDEKVRNFFFYNGNTIIIYILYFL